MRKRVHVGRGVEYARTGVLAGGANGPVPVVVGSLIAVAIAVGIVHQAGVDGVRVWGIFIPLAALVIALRKEQWALAAAALVAAWWVAVVAVRYLPDLINPGPPVGQAVGGAAVFDTPYRGPQLAAAVSVAVPNLVALCAAAVPRLRTWRDRSETPIESMSSKVEQAMGTGRGAIVVWVGGAVLALTLVPDLRDYLRHAGDPISYSWDYSNQYAWQLFVQMGFVPMRDFFYPYGFQWLFTMRSVGPLLQWLTEVAMLGLAGWSIWRISRGQAWRVLACLVTLILVGQWGNEAWRYIPAFLVGIVYAALGPARHRRLERAHGIFFAVCLLAVFIGPDVLLLGLVAAGLVLLGEIVAWRPLWSPRRLATGVAIDAVPVLGSVLVIALVWLAMGTLSTNLRFLTDFSAISSADALNEKLYGSLGLMVLQPAAYSIWVAVPALLTTIGFVGVWFARRCGGAFPGAILLAASGVAFFLLLKHLVRPVNDEILVAPLIGLTWVAILVWRRESILVAVASAAAVAAVLALLGKTGVSPTQYVRDAIASPVHAARSLGVVFDPGARVRADRARADPGRFASWPDTAIATDFAETVPVNPLPSFAIVGDSQLAYALLRQRPPYQVELYDAAPIAEQRRMVGLLEQRRPQYVIWRKDFSQDDFPYDVRVPLLFRWMIDNYVPVRVFPTVDILRRRDPGAPLPHTFWRSELGGTEDLGFIPSFSTAASSPSCSGAPGCVRYAMLQGRPQRGSAGIGLVVTGNKDAFGVLLRMRPGVQSYPVRLDRLWFWSLVGPTATLTSLTPGFRVRLVGRRSGDNLY